MIVEMEKERVLGLCEDRLLHLIHSRSEFNKHRQERITEDAAEVVTHKKKYTVMAIEAEIRRIKAGVEKLDISRFLSSILMDELARSPIPPHGATMRWTGNEQDVMAIRSAAEESISETVWLSGEEIMAIR